MPTLTVNKTEFERLVGKKLPLEQLKDRISYLGTDLEKIENDEIVVEIFPNRPDMLSMQGFVRAFAGFIGVRPGLIKYPVRKSPHKVIIDDSVKKYRPFTACALVKKLKLNDERIREIIQIQEKLHVTYGRHRKKAAIGIYPFEKIQTPIRFYAEKPEKVSFVPLEGGRLMDGKEILTQHPTGREYAHLLEGMDKYPFFADAKDEILSMPPVINSETVGKIVPGTTEVFIECSGSDFAILKKCLNMIVCAFADMGGEIHSMELVYGEKKIVSPQLEPEKMRLSIQYVNKMLGLQLSEADVRRLLERMGYSYAKGVALVPAYRADVMHEIDLVEDIAIAYGFDQFKDESLNASTVGVEDQNEIFRRRLIYILIGFGLLETSTYHLTNEQDLVKNMQRKTPFVRLEKASSVDYDILRSWLLPSLLGVLRINKHHDYPQRIFEIGTVFAPDSASETGVAEHQSLSVCSCHKDATFTEVRQYLEYILSALKLGYVVEEAEHPSFVPGRACRFVVDGTAIGIVGEVHPGVLSSFNVEMPAAAMEIDVDALFMLTTAASK